MYDGPVIDACVNHTWDNQFELMEYMSEGWRDYLGVPNLLPDGGGMITIAPALSYQRPGAIHAASDTAGVKPSVHDLVKAHIQDDPRIERVVLAFGEAALATAVINPYLAVQIASAANKWTVERWLGADARCSSLMIVATQAPDQAAAEIRSVGRNSRISGVLMAGNGLGKAFGHPIYHPIYEAAAEMNLAIVLKAGTEALPDSPAGTAGAGEPATYAEFRILENNGLMTHVTTMITQGVFEKYSNLRLLLIGGGTVWVPAYLWRFDSMFKGLRREVPWVKWMPSEYFRRHVRIGSYPADPIPDAALAKARNAFPDFDDVVCFASCYPNWDHTQASAVLAQLPPGAAQKVMHANASFVFAR